MPMIVDTDVFSFFYKRDTRAANYERHLSGQDLIISFMTLAELEYWSLASGWGQKRRENLRVSLNRYVIYTVSLTLCRKWAEVVDGARRRGRVISTNDAWIAATALLLEAPLVTHNARDFGGIIGLKIISES